MAGDLSVGNIEASLGVESIYGTTTIAGVVSGSFTCSGGVGGDVRLTSPTAYHSGPIELSNLRGGQRLSATCSVLGGHTLTCSGYPCQLTIHEFSEGAMVHLEQGAGVVTIDGGLTGQVDGTLWIQGDVASLLTGCPTSSVICIEGDADTFETLGVEGDVMLGGLTGSMQLYDGALSGRLYIGTLSGSLGGVADVSGRLTVDELASGGEVTVDGSVSGSVTVRDPEQSGIAGDITMGELTTSGELTLNGSFTGNLALSDLAGTVTIAGSLVDGGSVSVSNDLAGALVINGDLGAAEGDDCSISAGDLVDGGHITVGDGLRQTGDIIIGGASDEVWDDEFITIGYAGPPDYWFAPATVTVSDGPQAGAYHWSAPEHHIFLVGCKRGDLNSDEAVDALDLDIYEDWIYLQADPLRTFCAEFPWFCGAVHYLGNADCAGGLTGSEAEHDALVLKINNPNQWYQQHPFCEMGCLSQGGLGFFFGGYDFEYSAPGEAPGGGPFGAEAEGSALGGGDAAADMAAMMRSVFDDDYLPDLIALCEEAAAAATDPDVTAFWAQVAVELSGG